MMNMKGQNALITVIIMIVGAVVGLSIVNSVMTQAANLDYSAQGSLNWTSPAGYTLSPCNLGIDAATFTNATNGAAYTADTHYSINKDTCLVKNLTQGVGSTLFNVTYTYADTQTYSSSLSRTIAAYVVPLGLLGILGMAVMIAL